MPIVTNLSSSGCGSSFVKACGSSNTPTASANEMPCFFLFDFAFDVSHWNDTPECMHECAPMQAVTDPSRANGFGLQLRGPASTDASLRALAPAGAQHQESRRPHRSARRFPRGLDRCKP